MSDNVDHPKHYTDHPSGVECIEVVRHFNFNRGGAIKYIWRAGEKDPSKEIEDLKKAIWLLEDEVKRLTPTIPSPPWVIDKATVGSVTVSGV